MIDDEVLDVSDALGDWTRPRLIKTVTVTTVDFKKVEQVAGRTQECMVQVAQPEQLIKRGLDVSVRHIRVHSEHDIDMKGLIEFNGKDYRVVTPSQWDGYGYVDVMAAETKEPLRVVNV